jgi:hypothetical protein
MKGHSRRLGLALALALAVCWIAPLTVRAAPAIATQGSGQTLAGQTRAGTPLSAAGPAVLAERAATATEGDARALRLALIVALTIALVGCVVAQYQTVSDDRGGRATWDGSLAHPTPGPDKRRPRAGAAYRASLVEREPASAVPGLTVPRGGETGWDAWAEGAAGDCARAVAAAFLHDRAGTLAAFTTALERDPRVRPGATPGFWEMPPGGHADLARAYLRRGRPLDARSVLTVARLTFEHDRELEALQREIADHPGSSCNSSADHHRWIAPPAR